MKKLNITKQELILKYIKEKKSLSCIAKYLKCAPLTIKRRLIKYNIKIRNYKEAMKITPPPFKNKHHSEETKKIMSILKLGKNSPNYIDGRSYNKYYCKDCGKEISRCSAIYGKCRCQSCAKRGKNHHNYGKKRPEHSLRMKGKNNPFFNKKHDNNFKLKMSLQKQKLFKNPKNHPNWKNGISFEIYPIEFNESLKNKIRERDNHICQLCGYKEIQNRRKLDVHHIDYNKKNCKEDNLITLCPSCHMRTNGNRNYWLNLFLKKRLIYV